MKKLLLILAALLLVSCDNAIYQVDDSMGQQFQKYTTTLDQYKDFSYVSSDDTASAEALDETCSSRLLYSDEYDSIIMIADVPYLYNDRTGNLGSLCIDPLCFHNIAECPYHGLISGVVFTSNKAYFNALDPADGMYVYYELDLESGRKRELRRRPMGAQVLSQYFDEEYAYFYDIIEEDNSEKRR